MKITTQIMVTIAKDDGTEVKLGRSVTTEHGSNPSFERSETAGAVRGASEEFVNLNALHGTRTL